MVEANKAFQYTMGELGKVQLPNLSSPHLVIQEMLQHRCNKAHRFTRCILYLFGALPFYLQMQQQWQTMKGSLSGLSTSCYGVG